MITVDENESHELLYTCSVAIRLNLFYTTDYIQVNVAVGNSAPILSSRVKHCKLHLGYNNLTATFRHGGINAR